MARFSRPSRRITAPSRAFAALAGSLILAGCQSQGAAQSASTGTTLSRAERTPRICPEGGAAVDGYCPSDSQEIDESLLAAYDSAYPAPAPRLRETLVIGSNHIDSGQGPQNGCSAAYCTTDANRTGQPSGEAAAANGLAPAPLGPEYGYRGYYPAGYYPGGYYPGGYYPGYQPGGVVVVEGGEPVESFWGRRRAGSGADVPDYGPPFPFKAAPAGY